MPQIEDDHSLEPLAKEGSVVTKTDIFEMTVRDELPAANSEVMIDELDEICAKFDLGNLVLPNDDFSKVDQLIDRVSMTINGEPLTELSLFIANDLLVENPTLNIKYTGPIYACWKTRNIQLGSSIAELSFLQSNGVEAIHRWEFEVFDN